MTTKVPKNLQGVVNDLTNIASNKESLTNFLSSPTAEKLEKANPKLIAALHSVLNFTDKSLQEIDPNSHKIMISMIGPHINQIQNAKGSNTAKKIMVSKGGAFWSHVGHWFSHAAHAVGHAFKKAGTTVFNKVLKPAAKGIESVGKDVYHGLKEAGEWVYDHRKIISKAIDIATKVLSVLPIPYVQEIALEISPYVNAANKVIQGTGIY